MTNEELYNKITKLLGETWRSVKWSRMKGRYSTDVFAHRLIVASRQESIRAFFTKLCHGLSLQAPINVTSADLDVLTDYEQEVLKLIREWPQYFVYKAYEYAKYKQELNEKEKNLDKNDVKNLLNW